MNADQAKLCIQYLSAAYPQTTMGQGTIVVWCEHIAGQDARDAMAACRRLVRSNKWMPSIAEFLEACRIERTLRESMSMPVSGELGTGEKDAEVRARQQETAAQFIALAKETLKSQRAAFLKDTAA